MTKIPNCPVCHKPAKIVDTKIKGRERYHIRCGCLQVQLRGQNIPDLEANWKRWGHLAKYFKIEKEDKLNINHMTNKQLAEKLEDIYLSGQRFPRECTPFMAMAVFVRRYVKDSTPEGKGKP